MKEELIRRIAYLKPVSQDSSRSYEEHVEVLTERVNGIMSSREDVFSLIGNNTLTVMTDNHMNHGNFITNVLKFNNFALLARTLPWVYRSYLSRGFSRDYFPAVLKAWKEAIGEQLPETASKEILGVYDWMIEQHGLLVETVGEESGSLDIEYRDNEHSNAFADILLSGNSREALSLAEESVSLATDLGAFYLGVVQPALYKIGLLWERGEISVADEHLATAIVGRIMAAMYPKFAHVSHDKGEAVLACSPNEYHELGSRIVADLLEISGWNVAFLGASTPAEELMKLLRAKKPFLLGVSVAMSFNLGNTSKLLETIRKDPALSSTKVVLGGLALSTAPGLWKELGADGFARDGNEAIEIANEWWMTAS